MHNAEAAIEPAFYDHEDEIVQRDRAAADWGADEVFASVPRRRMRGDHAAARRPGARRVSGPAIEEVDEDATARAAWLADVEAELAAGTVTEAVPAPAEVPTVEELTAGVAFDDAPAAWTQAAEEPAGRRTVTITGNPGRPLVNERRRPPRSVDERIGGRPDRAAGWAFGMGLLLIVVAAFS